MRRNLRCQKKMAHMHSRNVRGTAQPGGPGTGGRGPGARDFPSCEIGKVPGWVQLGDITINRFPRIHAYSGLRQNPMCGCYLRGICALEKKRANMRLGADALSMLNATLRCGGQGRARSASG